MARIRSSATVPVLPLRSEPAPAPGKGAYVLRISRLTIDKLGVKLYDKVSAVVAELVANSYDADAEEVVVRLPLSTLLATTGSRSRDQGYQIEVTDDGHGMAPEEAINYYLRVGTDRRRSRPDGGRSRDKKRPVMGRKGIGKLAPFGICKRIEVWSAGGKKQRRGYEISHFFMDFDKIVRDTDEDVPLERGSEDRKWSRKPGTKIRLTAFLPKRVPDKDTFIRQLAVRFTFARPDFAIKIRDARNPSSRPFQITRLDIPLLPGTRVNLAERPIKDSDGGELPVSGWLGMAKEAYKNEEMMGVRIYARGKIVAVTRDFNQPAGFTGEFAMRSYLVGEVQADWLDLDDGEDLVRTDRQDILWDSDYGQLLRAWGASLIKEIARISREPRRVRVRDLFLNKAQIEKKARNRFGDEEIVKAAVELAKNFGGFAAEDELEDADYVNDLSEIILSVAPHRALMEAFHEFSNQVTKGTASIAELVSIFDKTQIAELASYAQVAAERVKIIDELDGIVGESVPENKFQELLAKAPWLIEPTWTVITTNQNLRTFKDQFEKFWKTRTGENVSLAVTYEDKRPDFTLVNVGGMLHIVEIKASGHKFDDADFTRLHNYVEAFEEFFDANSGLASEFSAGWRIDLVADGEKIKNAVNLRALREVKASGHLKRISWIDFLTKAKKANESFLDISATARTRRNRS